MAAKTTPFLFFSAFLNIALTLAAWLLFNGPTAGNGSASRDRWRLSARSEEEKVVLTNAASVVLDQTNRFHWQQIESPDYEQYAANLRGIGCPETTVRDILLADVTKHYKSRRSQLSRSQPFWIAGRQRREAVRANAREQLRLQEEEQSVIRQLLRLDWCGEKSLIRNLDLTEQAVSRFLYGPMPEESVQRMVFLLAKYDCLRERLNEQTDGIRTDDDEAQIRRWEYDYVVEVRQTLSPMLFEEAFARGNAFEFFEELLVGEVLDLNPAEARQISIARGQDPSLLLLLSDWPHTGRDEERKLRYVGFTNEVARILGDQRFLDFQRTQDSEFREIYSFTTGNQLSKETAIKVYEMRRAAIDELARIRNDGSLDETIRHERLGEMRATLEAAVSGILGAKAYEEYLRERGSWITNFAQL